MPSFSERYGYVKPIEVVRKEEIHLDLENSLCTCFDILDQKIYHDEYVTLEQYLWINFLYKRYNDFYSGYSTRSVIVPYIKDKNVVWYRKFDMIEKSLSFLQKKYCEDHEYDGTRYPTAVQSFVQNINHYLKELNYGYRIVDYIVVPVSSEEEVETVKLAINQSKDNVTVHLHSALELYSKRPDADYRNSIKESISAVEAFCREQTGESTLGPALKNLEKKGVVIPKMLVVAFEKLYAYTCQPDNGIRHALMDEEATYMPGQEEAMFMLVSCSAFLNYLYSKLAK